MKKTLQVLLSILKYERNGNLRELSHLSPENKAKSMIGPQ
jgi:hypothetical protein